ncbi:MAG: hypothetical protein V8S08_05035 [Lachnoclostridium sp.]
MPIMDGMPFVDVLLGSWYYDYVKYVFGMDLIDRKHKHCTLGENLARAQFAVVLYRMDKTDGCYDVQIRKCKGYLPPRPEV